MEPMFAKQFAQFVNKFSSWQKNIVSSRI